MGTKQSLRSGGITTAEKNLITQVVLDQPGPMRPAQVTALAKTLRRSTDAVKKVIEDARDTLRENAQFYVDSHKSAVSDALSNGDAKSLAVAATASQWAIERITAEGVGLIEKKAGDSGDKGPKVIVGIRIGGIDATKALDVTATEVKD